MVTRLSLHMCFLVMQEKTLQDEGWRELTIITTPEFEGYSSGKRASPRSVRWPTNGNTF